MPALLCPMVGSTCLFMGNKGFADIGTRTGLAREHFDDNFTERDANIADLEHIYELAAECGFAEPIGDMVEDIRSVMMPDLVRLQASAQDSESAEVAKRRLRLQNLLDRAGQLDGTIKTVEPASP